MTHDLFRLDSEIRKLTSWFNNIAEDVGNLVTRVAMLEVNLHRHLTEHREAPTPYGLGDDTAAEEAIVARIAKWVDGNYDKMATAGCSAVYLEALSDIADGIREGDWRK